MSSGTLIAVDWGTTSLRGARLDAGGAVLESRSVARGILAVPAGGFAAEFDAHFGDWMGAPGTTCLIAGMAGSRQGWIEAPYVACPAGPHEVAAARIGVDHGGAAPVAIVPGLSCEHDGAPDVMRGEETQVFGALAALGLDEALLVLPGTHSKWVRVERGRIVGFSTAMTGEFYALLRRHSILARMLPPDDADADWDGAAFDAGVAHALRCAGLLQAAFSVRTLALFDRLPEAGRASYLSGVVIGEEIRSRPHREARRVVAVGADALTQRYARALAACGVAVDRIGAEATWRGLHAIAQIPAHRPASS